MIAVSKKILTYVAIDGTEFDSEAECLSHEKNSESKKLKLFILDKYETKHRHPLNEQALERITNFIKENIDSINSLLRPTPEVWVPKSGEMILVRDEGRWVKRKFVKMGFNHITGQPTYLCEVRNMSDRFYEWVNAKIMNHSEQEIFDEGFS